MDREMDSIYLLQPDKSLVQISQSDYLQEHELQQLLDEYPELLPGAQINPASPRRWLVVRSEAGIPKADAGSDWWAVDHLLLDQDGIPTFVEVKLSRDTRIRREVVAQMLEYAANGTAYWDVGKLRGWLEASEQITKHQPGKTLDGLLEGTGLDADHYWTLVEDNLRSGHVRCIFVADTIPPTLRRLVEFLNEHLDTVEILAVELPQYVGHSSDIRALTPRLVGQTARAQAKKEPSTSTKAKWDEDRFLTRVWERFGAEDASVCRSLLEWWKRHADGLEWGSGENNGAVGPVVRGGGRTQKPFNAAMWSGGQIDINFKELKSYPPFNNEQIRWSLVERLNEIDGVKLEKVEGYPAIPFRVLHKPEALQQFLSISEWVIGLIRGA